MNNKAVKVTGTQVKELLTRAVGGIYLGRRFSDIMTDYFEKCEIADRGIKINVDDTIALTVPVDETEQYINYAISGEDLEADEIWEGSTYFDYKFCIGGYTVCFNVEDKGTELTWEQFKELADIRNYAILGARNLDAGAIYLDIDDCTIAVNDREIEINSEKVNAIIDRDIIETIYNDSADAGGICYRLEFCNGMADMVIDIEYGHRLFR